MRQAHARGWQTDLLPDPGVPVSELDLLMAIRRLGIQIVTDGERLFWRARRGDVTPELRAGLTAHREWLIRFLLLDRWEHGTA